MYRRAKTKYMRFTFSEMTLLFVVCKRSSSYLLWCPYIRAMSHSALRRRKQTQHNVVQYSVVPVSYTHLDVYKRQDPDFLFWLTSFYKGEISLRFQDMKVTSKACVNSDLHRFVNTIRFLQHLSG